MPTSYIPVHQMRRSCEVHHRAGPRRGFVVNIKYRGIVDYFKVWILDVQTLCWALLKDALIEVIYIMDDLWMTNNSQFIQGTTPKLK